MTLFGLFGVVIHWLFLGAEGAVQQKQDFDRCSRSLHMCYMRWVPINSGSSSRSSRLLSSCSLLSSLALIIYWGPLYFVISSVSKRDYYVQGVPTSSALPHIFWINSGFFEFFSKISFKSGHKNWGFMDLWKKLKIRNQLKLKSFVCAHSKLAWTPCMYYSCSFFTVPYVVIMQS